MYITEPAPNSPRGTVSLPLKAVLAVSIAGMLWLGILPGTLMNLITGIFNSGGFRP